VSLHHKLIFLFSAIMAAVWTFLFWRLAFPRRAGPPRKWHGGCNHHWHRLENYDDGRAKARCLKCSKVAIVQVSRPPSRRS